MSKWYVSIGLAVVIVLAVVFAGCPKAERKTSALPPGPRATPAGPAGPAAEAVKPGETAKPGEAAKPAEAATAAAGTLTREKITNWVASAKDPKIKAIMEKIKTGDDKTKKDPAAFKKSLEDLGSNAELEAAVKAHGFSSAKEWTATTIKMFAGIMPEMLPMGLAMAEGMGHKKGSPEYQKLEAEVQKEVDGFHKSFGELSPEETKLIKEMMPEIMAGFGAGGKAGAPPTGTGKP